MSGMYRFFLQSCFHLVVKTIDSCVFCLIAERILQFLFLNIIFTMMVGTGVLADSIVVYCLFFHVTS